MQISLKKVIFWQPIKENRQNVVGLFGSMLNHKNDNQFFKLWKHFASHFPQSCLEDPVIICELWWISYKYQCAIFHSFKRMSRCFICSALGVNEVSLFQMSRVLHLSHPVKMELAYQYPPGATRSSTVPMPRMKRTAVRQPFKHNTFSSFYHRLQI